MTSHLSTKTLRRFENVLRSTEKRRARSFRHMIDRLQERACAFKKEGHCERLTSELGRLDERIDDLEGAIAATQLRLDQANGKREQERLLALLEEQIESKEGWEARRLAVEWKSALFCREYEALQEQIDSMKEAEEELRFFECEFWRLLCESEPDRFQRMLCDVESEMMLGCRADPFLGPPEPEPTLEERIAALEAQEDELASALETIGVREQALGATREDLLADQAEVEAQIRALEEQVDPPDPGTKKTTKKRSKKTSPSKSGRPRSG